jgi:hypothetical protein
MENCVICATPFFQRLPHWAEWWHLRPSIYYWSMASPEQMAGRPHHRDLRGHRRRYLAGVLKSGVYPTLTASAVSAVLGCTLLWWFLKKGGSGIEW